MYADAEGNNRRANIPGQTSYNEQVIKLLRKNGWSVINKSENKTNRTSHQVSVMEQMFES